MTSEFDDDVSPVITGGSSNEGRSWLGNVVYDPNTGEPLGVVKGGSRGAGLFIDRLDGRVFPIAKGGVFATGSGELIELNGRGQVVSARDIPASRFFGSGGGGGGPSAIDTAAFQHELQFDPRLIDLAKKYAEIEIATDKAKGRNDLENTLILEREKDKLLQAAEERGFQRDKFLLAVQQQFQSRENRLDRENSLRQQAISNLSQLQAQARQLIAQTLGQDPFRAAALSSGQVTIGRTPARGFRQQLQQIANQPTAHLATAPIEQVQETLQQTLPGLPAPPALGAPGATALGLAGGGSVQMAKDPSGRFVISQDDLTPTTRGPTGIGVMVGERGPEVLEVREDGLRVIPLATRAQGGLEITRTPAVLSPTASLSTAAGSTTQPAEAAPPVSRPVLAGPTLAQAEPMARAAEQQVSLAGQEPAVQPAGMIETPEADAFIRDILGRWPNVDSRDSLHALDLGLRDVSDAILRFTSQLMTADEAYSIIVGHTRGGAEGLPLYSPDQRNFLRNLLGTIDQALASGNQNWWGSQPPAAWAQEANRLGLSEVLGFLQSSQSQGAAWLRAQIAGLLQEFPAQLPPGGPPPSPIPEGPNLPVEDEVTFLNDLVGRWPNVTIQDALLADQHRLPPEVGQAIRELVAGTITDQEAFARLQQFIPGLQQPTTPTFDVGSMRQAIAALWQHLGLRPFVTEEGALGSPFAVSDLPAGVLPSAFPGQALEAGAIRPRLYRQRNTGQVFIMDDEGMLHAITSPGQSSVQELAEFGIDPNDVLELPSGALGLIPGLEGIGEDWLLGFGFGRQRVTELLQQPSASPFPQLSQPLIEPVTGMMLPAVRMVAALLPRLQTTNPALYDLILQAYEVAGFPLTAVAAEQRFFTPQGSGQRVTALG